MTVIWLIVAVGVGATLWTDLINELRRRLLGATVPDYASVGRWIGHMRYGKFTHASIRQADTIRGERLLGWCVHYVIGVAFAGALIVWQGVDWLYQPVIMPALLFGVMTVLFPFLLLQPALGAGFAASRTPSPAKARWGSLINHVLFGLGLYVTAWALTMFI